MKQITFLLAVLIPLLIISPSCSKQSRDEMRTKTEPPQTINATVSAGNAYSLNVTNFGAVSISRQAAHFTVSQIETDSKDGILLYKYIPQNDYTGPDEVELSTSKTSYSSGSGCNGGGGRMTTYHSNIIIKFIVTK